MSDYPEPTQWNGDDDREQVCSDDPLTCDCPECRVWRENREVSEPDGEDFRGHEAAGYLAEQQHAAQRLKR